MPARENQQQRQIIERLCRKEWPDGLQRYLSSAERQVVVALQARFEQQGELSRASHRVLVQLQARCQQRAAAARAPVLSPTNNHR